MRFNFYLAATASAWLLTALVIAAELSMKFKTLLTSVFTHHWIAKFILITLAFVISGFLSKKERYKDIAWFSVISSLIVILIFYIIMYYI